MRRCCIEFIYYIRSGKKRVARGEVGFVKNSCRDGDSIIPSAAFPSVFEDSNHLVSAA
jgi:hypothetical protein